jgi:hypothetical protein
VGDVYEGVREWGMCVGECVGDGCGGVGCVGMGVEWGSGELEQGCGPLYNHVLLILLLCVYPY